MIQRTWDVLLASGLLAVVVSFLLPGLVAAQVVSNPREMLDVMQIDASQREQFVDDRAIADEFETLGKVLFRLPNFSQRDVDRWTKPMDDVSAMLSNPDSYRFEMFDLRGQVVGLQELEVIPELVPRLGFRNYFAVTIQLEKSGGNDLAAAMRSVVYSRSIPQRWHPVKQDNPVGEAVRVQGLLLKRGVDADGNSQLVFAASRINWHPSKPSERYAITSDQVLLGQLGLDVDRLSDLVHRTKMTSKDREAFYQALSSVRLAEPQQLARIGKREFDIGRLLRTPERVVGELHTVSGLALRAILIHVEDNDIRERFGIDHYYEVEVFVPLDRQVRFVDPDEPKDAEGKVFADYPFVACVPQLPRGMEQGDDIRVPVVFSGFFLKLWAYETEFMSGGRARTASARLQQSPLFVAPTLLVGSEFQPQESQLSLYIACLFIGLLLLLWLWLWRSSVQDQQASKRLFRKNDPGKDAFELLS